MCAKRSSKQIKGKKKGNTSAKKKVQSQSTSTPKVVVQTSSVKEETPKPKANKISKPASPSTSISLPFSRQNYILLAAGVGIIILGFFLMSLDNFVDATKFSISLYIAPIVVMAGFAEIIYAIMYRPKSSPQTQDTGQ